MLNPDILRHELASTLKASGATPEKMLFGCPNPESTDWKLGMDFRHRVGIGIVTVWQSGGCCDIDFLPEGHQDGIALHGEFDTDTELLQFVTSSLASLSIHA